MEFVDYLKPFHYYKPIDAFFQQPLLQNLTLFRVAIIAIPCYPLTLTVIKNLFGLRRLNPGWEGSNAKPVKFRRCRANAGHDAPDALIEYADLVTEMKVFKHPYDQGLKAQPGIEY